MNNNNSLGEATLRTLFSEYFSEQVEQVEVVPQSGSDRKYFILRSKNNVAIGACNADLKENDSYFYFTKLFLEKGLPVPEIYLKNKEQGCYLMQYFTGSSLLGLLQEKGFSQEVLQVYERVVDYLVRFQLDAVDQVDYAQCHAAKHFDRHQIFADLMYFKYYFLDMHQVSYATSELMGEMQEVADRLSTISPRSFMYRDFQARNIIVDAEGKPAFIDFQGGMEGIPQYDLVSLLWQARAQLPDEWKEHLYLRYVQAFLSHPKTTEIDSLQFRNDYEACILLRILQTLGAYGFRGLIEQRIHFLKSIHPALIQLKTFVGKDFQIVNYPELGKVIAQITDDSFIDRYQEKGIKTYPNADKLTVSVYSFSFKKGPAADSSGNGGGFVFDCRGILNPGREEAYKSLTGRDAEVIQYLESKTRMPQYLSNIFDVIDTQVEDFLQRGFEHLSISFGCTGGQHRSVYAAEQTAKYLREKYGLSRVNLLHLEQDQNDKQRAFGGV